MMSSRTADISERQAARIAGLAYVIIIILAFFANFFVLERLVEPGNPTATVSNIIKSEGLFRSGVVALIGVFVSDVVATWALYIFFKRVSRDVSLLTAWLRLVTTTISLAALLNLLVAALLVGSADYSTALGVDQRDAQAMLFLDAFHYGWTIALACFGVYLLLLGFMSVKADYVPSILGILLVMAGLGYIADNLLTILLPAYENYGDPAWLLPAIVGEFSLTGWLLSRGGKQQDALQLSAGR